MVTMSLLKFVIIIVAVLIFGVISGRFGHKIPRAYGYLILEPDNSGALVDLDGVKPGRLLERDVVGLQVRRVDIQKYLEAKKHTRFKIDLDEETQDKHRS